MRRSINRTFAVFTLSFLVVALMISQGLKLGSLRRIALRRGFATVQMSSKIDEKIVSTETRKNINIVNNRNIANEITEKSINAMINTAINMNVNSLDKGMEDQDFKTFVKYKDDGGGSTLEGAVDEVGLPLVYDRKLIEAYWKKQGSALTKRWTEFLAVSLPFISKIIRIVVTGGNEELVRNTKELARDARIILEKLGPTYVKLGQMLSVRPDLLPNDAIKELQILQDSVRPFETEVALRILEEELGFPASELFSEISAEPIAAASLAQVYRARLKHNYREILREKRGALPTGISSVLDEIDWRDGDGDAERDIEVAIKVQRPQILELVSKDLYVLRRATEVYQYLMNNFIAPKQRTSYLNLFQEFAVGFYTELDFLNEAQNQLLVKNLLRERGVESVYIPHVFREISTRKVMVSEFVRGTKLSRCDATTINSLIFDAQEAFLTQLLQLGYFHADPHPGNIMYILEPRKHYRGARLALLDFGLIARIDESDMQAMISALIHLANRDFSALVDDMIALNILPAQSRKDVLIPLMDKALTPYIKGGGAKRYEMELTQNYQRSGGGFQEMYSDMLTVLNEVPFSIPSYFALLGRAIITLEGIALTGDPNYAIVKASYPFVVKKLLQDNQRDGREHEMRGVLQELLFAERGALQLNRLSVLVNSVLLNEQKRGNSSSNSSSIGNSSSGSSGAGAFIDLDSLPAETASATEIFKFMLSQSATSLRALLIPELTQVTDILARQLVRKLSPRIISAFSPKLPGILGRRISLSNIPLPVLVPRSPENLLRSNAKTLPLTLQTLRTEFSPVLLRAEEIVDLLAPRLTREEEVYALSIADALQQMLEHSGVEQQSVVDTFGLKLAELVSGDLFIDAAGNDAKRQRLLATILRAARDSIDSAFSENSSSESNVLQRQLAALSSAQRRTLQQVYQISMRPALAQLLRALDSTRNNNDDSRLVYELFSASNQLSSEEEEVLRETVAAICWPLFEKILFRMHSVLKN